MIVFSSRMEKFFRCCFSSYIARSINYICFVSLLGDGSWFPIHQLTKYALFHFLETDRDFHFINYIAFFLPLIRLVQADTHYQLRISTGKISYFRIVPRRLCSWVTSSAHKSHSITWKFSSTKHSWTWDARETHKVI